MYLDDSLACYTSIWSLWNIPDGNTTSNHWIMVRHVRFECCPHQESILCTPKELKKLMCTDPKCKVMFTDREGNAILIDDKTIGKCFRSKRL